MPKTKSISCTVPNCSRTFVNRIGLTKHLRRMHRGYRPSPGRQRSESPDPSQVEPNQQENGEGFSVHAFSSQQFENDPNAANTGIGVFDQALGSSVSSPAMPDPDTAGTSRLQNERRSRRYAARVEDDVDVPDVEFDGVQPSTSPPVESSSSGGDPLPSQPQPNLRRFEHTFLNGRPCDENGEYLQPGMPPPPRYPNNDPEDWFPYEDRVEFLTAELLYCKSQMSASAHSTLMQLWSMTLAKYNDVAPFANHQDMLNTIDATRLGGVPWQSFDIRYSGPTPSNQSTPQWMSDAHTVFFRDPRLVVQDMLSNPTYKDGIDYTPLRVFNTHGDRQYENLMSGNWAWEQADEISKDPSTRGAMFVPIILGSDKTTVSVATGHNEYWPLYLSIGNVHNNIRRAHQGALIPIAFLAIPKGSKTDAQDPGFRHFRRQVFHSSLSRVLDSLRAGMTTPEVVRCPDNHFRRAIYGLGPYIGDYPEQVLLSCIVQGWCARSEFTESGCPVDETETIWHRCTSPKKGQLEPDAASISRTRKHTEELIRRFNTQELWEGYGIIATTTPFTNDFPRADIHELLSPDLLHQIIKGTFKDHLVTWVTQYIEERHTEARAREILDEIDRRIALAPPFSGLRRFPQGRGFKQWTGDDSKALMKVYLSAIESFVPRNVVRALQAFLDFCYIARRNVITEASLSLLEDANARYQHYRMVFKDIGIREDGFGLPRQHSMVHYADLIRLFGAPNGLCSSITEAKHIKAVKEPWRRSNRHNPLDQMLWTNQRLDKLAAARVEFTGRGMLSEDALEGILLEIEHIRQSQGAPVRKKGRRHEIEDFDSIVNDPSMLAHVALARKPRWKKHIRAAAEKIHTDNFPELIRRFLYDQLYPLAHWTSADVSLATCPAFEGRITAFPSATSVFFAPSDPSGITGMRREHIRATPRWRRGPARYDCVFVHDPPRSAGRQDGCLPVARIRLFFSFCYRGTTYPCALVHWYSVIGNQPDQDTGMWMVTPEIHDGEPNLGVIHVSSILRAAHLLPISGDVPVPRELSFSDSLNVFQTFYINKYADHHSFEVAS